MVEGRLKLVVRIGCTVPHIALHHHTFGAGASHAPLLMCMPVNEKHEGLVFGCTYVFAPSQLLSLTSSSWLWAVSASEHSSQTP